MLLRSFSVICALGVAGLIATPLAFIIHSALTVDSTLWVRLYETRLKLLLLNTIKLLLGVGFLVSLFGVFWAWIFTRYEFWGRSIWQVILLLPYAIPGYVMAYAYSSLSSPNSPFKGLIDWVTNVFSLPSLYSFWGVALILSFINYPYVYLLARASLSQYNEVYEDVSRIYGLKGIRKFLQVDLRLAYPGIFAGLSLALMEVMSDFGTVSLLRYPTFTEAIYRQITGRFDPQGASALSLVLLLLTFFMLNLEQHFRGKIGVATINGKYRILSRKRVSLLGNIFLTILLLGFIFFSFFLPVGVLLYWASKSFSQELFDGQIVRYVLNTLLVSSAGALLASLFAFPIAYTVVRYSGPLRSLLYNLGTLGYSLPGPVIALSLLLFLKNISPYLIGSLLVVPLAYVIRFLPVAFHSQVASLSSVSCVLEEAGATLGANSFRIFRQILLPLMAPGFFTGFILVLVDSIKELPATLMLRPLAFDTLAVRVYTNAVESLWEHASVPALLMVFAGLVPVWFLIKMAYLNERRR